MPTTELFTQKARMVHGDLYGYQHVNYINAKSKVTIHCYKHGPFEQTANNHLSGQGCPHCAHENKLKRIRTMALTTDQFIEKSSIVHAGKYQYHNTRYVSSTKPVVVTCPIHGDFVIKRAEKHTYGQGCPQCNVGSTAEEVIKRILTTKGVLFYTQHTFDDCRSPSSNRKLPFDFYVPVHNLLIEYDGEQHTRKSPLFHVGDRYERQQAHDNIKTQFAHNSNITLLRISHHEFANISRIIDANL